MSDQHDDMTEDELEASLLADEQAAATVVQTTTAAPPELGDPGPVWDDVVGQSTAVQHLRAAAARGLGTRCAEVVRRRRASAWPERGGLYGPVGRRRDRPGGAGRA